MLLHATLWALLAIALFALVWLTLRQGAPSIADWIMGTTEPFAHPGGDGHEHDEPRPLRLMSAVPSVQTMPAPRPSGRRPDLLVLDLTDDDLAVRRQSHRNVYVDAMLSRHGTAPHPRLAAQWWPGTQPSDSEIDYAQGK